MRAFRLTEKELRPGCREIGVEGELDLAVADQLQAAIDGITPEADQILISLKHCEFIDSTGLLVIVRAYQKLGKEGRRIAVFGASDQVWRILSVTGLTSNGLVFKHVYEAIAGF